MENGHFIISLDFELHWGLFDLMEPDEYSENLINVATVIDKLLKLSDQYNVKLTFATVGFLFVKNKAELINLSPTIQPTYTNTKLNAYSIINKIGNDESDDPYHFAYTQLSKIKNNPNHEIGTHTFSHYYCNEEGQTLNQFNADLSSAKKVADNFGLDVKSIVFPRNQVNKNYLNSSLKYGITSYRGTEKSFIYSISPESKYYSSPIIRLLRLVDSYFNLTGHNTYNLSKLNKNNVLLNLPSSRFLRPYNKTLKLFEQLKIRRIKKSMTYAAKHKELFHLWWHPHNFGTQMEQNLKNLESIFKEYKKLNDMYMFESTTMTGLASKTAVV